MSERVWDKWECPLCDAEIVWGIGNGLPILDHMRSYHGWFSQSDGWTDSRLRLDDTSPYGHVTCLCGRHLPIETDAGSHSLQSAIATCLVSDFASHLAITHLVKMGASNA